MLYVLHGDNQVLSRKALTDLRDKFDPTGASVLGAVPLKELIAACEARSLFTPERLVIFEADGATAFLEDKDFLGYLKNLPEGLTLVVWVGESLRKNHALLKAVRSLGEERRFEISEEKPFPFLDALGDRDLVRAYRELKKLPAEEKSEVYLIQMIAWKLRTLIRAKDLASGGLNPYVYQRAKSQSVNFSDQELVRLMGLLWQGDLEMKTGALPKLVLDRLIDAIAGRAT